MALIYKKLIVDEYNDLFDKEGLTYVEFPSEYNKVRIYTEDVLKSCPDNFREGNLLHQQVSEIIKNAIKHGNQCDPGKKIKVWYSFQKRVRLIVEDEGEGFISLEAWNDFYRKRQEAIEKGDFDTYLNMASYRSSNSDESDGGNSLMAALEYWNGGMVYNRKKNKVGVIRWYTGGSEKKA